MPLKASPATIEVEVTGSTLQLAINELLKWEEETGNKVFYLRGHVALLEVAKPWKITARADQKGVDGDEA
jgi:ubiquinone biosynthesis protein UbiJ